MADEANSPVPPFLFFNPEVIGLLVEKGGPGVAEVERLVHRAEAIVCQRFPTIGERVDRGELDARVVAGVVEDMVVRVLEREARGGMDKLSYPEVAMEWADDGGLGSGSRLYLTTDEVVLLAPRPTGAISTLRPRIQPTLADDSFARAMQEARQW